MASHGPWGVLPQAAQQLSGAAPETLLPVFLQFRVAEPFVFVRDVESIAWGPPPVVVVVAAPRPLRYLVVDAPESRPQPLQPIRWGGPAGVTPPSARPPVLRVVDAPTAPPFLVGPVRYGPPPTVVQPTSPPRPILVVLSPETSVSTVGVGATRWGAANAATSVVVVLRLRMLTGMGL